jgi:putative nucleotidyltransferase with HDIG domain
VRHALPAEDMRQARIRELLPELELIGRPAWREAVVHIWSDVWAASQWGDPADCPKSAKDVHDVSNIDHTRSVTQQALATADIVERVHGVRIDRDVLVAGALLHDVSKLVESEPGPDGPRPNRTGRLVQHGVLGAGKAAERGLPDEIIHIVVCHTHQSATVPATIEAIIIHYVDFLDSDVLLLERNRPLFAKA